MHWKISAYMFGEFAILGMDIVDYGSPHSRPLAILFGASELCEQSCQLHPVCSRHHASNE